MKNNILVFGTKNFNNSLNEIENCLNFSLIFFNNEILLSVVIPSIKALLIDSDVCDDPKKLILINSIINKPTLLIEKPGFKKRCNHNDKIFTPFILSDFNTRLVSLITAEQFNQNSSIKIKEYTMDKNEKKLTKDYLSITVTEREIQLIELLFNETKPISKNNILKKVWKYSDDADTHTVETHIYRLRKKILGEFNDEFFILNSKLGYSI
jgi:hypothetical protein